VVEKVQGHSIRLSPKNLSSPGHFNFSFHRLCIWPIQTHETLKHWKCDWAKLRCAVNIIYKPEFENVVQNNTKSWLQIQYSSRELA
jgi:hypothetical protein